MKFFPVIILISMTSLLKGQSVDSLSYVMGRFNPAHQTGFVEIPISVASRGGMYLRKDAMDAFLSMQKEAEQQGIPLTIVSSTRNFYAQKRIWEAKWNGNRKVDGKNIKLALPDPSARALAILKYSSMPGTSRHHWGTDVDINSVNPDYFTSGNGSKEYEWLRDNAFRFGFCQVYSVKDEHRPHGYQEEKWHWSYMPVSRKLLNYYRNHVRKTDISGFDGSDALPFSQIMEYVLGISSECK